MRVLVFGINGMLGRAIFQLFATLSNFEVRGTIRNAEHLNDMPSEWQALVHQPVDANDTDDRLENLFDFQPDVVINCIGVIKQLPSAKDPLVALPVNSLFPHRLNQLCQTYNARLIHISTDCVFTGEKGNYHEDDTPDARDLYGLSKFLGEAVIGNAITLRTSIIGHEYASQNSLLDWFLAQKGEVNGFSKAIFSGLPTNELARVIKDYVLPNPKLTGLYHVSAEPINKYDLLNVIAEVYGKRIKINKTTDVIIDRSLNSERFKVATGYNPPNWPTLIEQMYINECRKKTHV